MVSRAGELDLGLLGDAPDPMAVVDDSGRVRSANKSAFERFGKGIVESSLQDLGGRIVASIAPGLHLATFEESIDLQKITDGLPSLVSYVGPDLCFRFANRTYSEWFGLPLTEIIGKPVREVLGDEAFSRVEHEIRRALAGEHISYEREMPYRFGGHRYVRTEIRPDRRGDGAVVGVIAEIQDLTAIRRAEEARRRSDERFHAAANSSFDAIFIFEAIRDERGAVNDFRFVEVNAQGEKLLGLTREQLIGHGMCELLPRNREQGFFDGYRRVLETGEPLEQEFGECAAGHVNAWFHQVTVPLRDGIAITVRDMTSQRRSMEALRDSERQLRLAMEAGQMGVWEWDAQSGHVSWSPGLESIHGLEPGTFAGTFEAYLRRVHPEDRPRVQRAFREWLQRELHHIEYRVQLDDGTVRWVEGQGRVFWENGKAVSIAGVCMDVTGRVEAERARRDSDARLRAFMENSPALCWVNDTDGRLEYVNSMFSRETGVSARAALGKTPRELFPAEYATEHLAHILQVARLRQPLTVNERAPRPDGTIGTYLVHKFPIDTPDGLRIGGIAVDISEQVEAETQLRALGRELQERVERRTADLEAAVRELEGFTYSVSHDLRAPLRAVHATSQILQEDFADDLKPEAIALLRRQAEVSNKMGVLIDDLLHLSRLARHEMDVQPLDLTKVAAEVVDELQAPADQIEIEPDMKAMGDVRLVRFVYQNLIQNALKFSPEGGKIRIGRTEDGAFFVSDKGIGFDMQYASKLFEPFQRLVRDSEFPGTGIGLANVHRIVLRHGGQVWAEGEPGHGATFYFTLPRGA